MGLRDAVEEGIKLLRSQATEWIEENLVENVKQLTAIGKTSLKIEDIDLNVSNFALFEEIITQIDAEGFRVKYHHECCARRGRMYPKNDDGGWSVHDDCLNDSCNNGDCRLVLWSIHW